jgi:hypothetical protein
MGAVSGKVATKLEAAICVGAQVASVGRTQQAASGHPMRASVIALAKKLRPGMDNLPGTTMCAD